MELPQTRSNVTSLSERDGFTPFRAPPHNVEAEQALLGAILITNDVAAQISSFLAATHFFEPAHGRIYDAALSLIDRGQIANPTTLRAVFERDPALTEVGGGEYLKRLTGAAVTIINVEDYGRLIYDLALRRQLITIGQDMVNIAFDSKLEETANGQIESAEQRLYSLAEKGKYEGGFRTFRQALTEAVNDAEAARKRDGHLTGVTTGFRDLNEKLGGLHRSDLIILAGRPSMGKTALATNIAFNACMAHLDAEREGREAQSEGAGVAFFSLEMSAAQLAARILAEATGITSERLRRGTLSNDDFDNLVMQSQRIEDGKLFIDDTPAITIATLRARARRLQRQHRIGMIVVDYLQLVRGSARNGEVNRVQEVSEITQGLKALAKELDLPVLALSQLSRQVEQRDDKRPQLSDLRESGAIEQDADVVMFIVREEYSLDRRQPREGTPEHDEWRAQMERVHSMAEVIVGKHRHGPTGNVKLHFQGSITKFSNWADPSHYPDPGF